MTNKKAAANPTVSRIKRKTEIFSLAPIPSNSTEDRLMQSICMISGTSTTMPNKCISNRLKVTSSSPSFYKYSISAHKNQDAFTNDEISIVGLQ